MHRRILITGVALVVLMPLAKAYTWHDTIGWAQYGVSEVINYANWAAQEANTAATELNTLHSYEQEVIQLARMGNPAALSQLTGVNSITSLYRDYAMISADIWQIENATNPAGFQSQFNSILAGHDVTLTPRVLEYVLREGWSPQFGARPLQQAALKALGSAIVPRLSESKGHQVKGVISYDRKRNRCELVAEGELSVVD